jgi:FkbM family methyltransferase
MLGKFLKDLVLHGLSGVTRQRGLTDTSEFRSAASEPENVIQLDAIHHLVHARHGWFLANSADHYIGAALIEYGEVAELEVKFLLSLVRPGDVVVEVGSNIGALSVPLAKAVGSDGLLVAFEPQPAIFRTLCANLALNSLSSVQTNQLGVGAQRDVMTIPSEAANYRTEPHNSGSMQLDHAGGGISVDVVTLDQILVNVSSIRLLKIDVEGMEARVLEGAAAMIKKHRPLIFVENDRPANRSALSAHIMALDYRLFWVVTDLYNPNNFFGSVRNHYLNDASFDMVCVPREMALPFTVTDQIEEIMEPNQRSRFAAE